MHCLKLPERRTRDHAPPRSWYPTAERARRQLPTAPSCGPCNGDLGEVERRLTETVGLALAGRRSVGARHVAKQAMRAYSAASGHDEADSRIRERKRRALIQDLVPSDAVTGPQIMRRPTGSTVAAKLHSRDLYRFGEKMVRVLTHHRFGEYIEPPLQVLVRPVLLEGFDKFEEVIRNEGIGILKHLPDVATYYWDTHWGPRAWALNLWGELRFVVLVGAAEDLARIPAPDGDVLGEHLRAISRRSP